MALIKCPNCGRDGISDCAEKCPECGYNVKLHFEKLRNEEKELELKKRLEEERRIAELTKQKEDREKQIECPECKKMFSEKLKACPYCGLSMDDKENIDRLYEIRGMEKDLKDKSVWLKPILYLILFTGLSILMFVLNSLDPDGITSTIAWIMAVCAVIYLIIIIVLINDRVAVKNDLKMAQTDYEKYKSEKRKRNAESLASLNKTAEERAKKDIINHPACPVCGSRNTMKISTINRAASVAMVGLASSKIGKQYQCKSCGHKW